MKALLKLASYMLPMISVTAAGSLAAWGISWGLWGKPVVHDVDALGLTLTSVALIGGFLSALLWMNAEGGWKDIG